MGGDGPRLHAVAGPGRGLGLRAAYGQDFAAAGQHFASAQDAFAQGQFELAAKEFQLAFDITRDPNPHLAFGGHGAHYCIGANLARLEVKIMLNEIADAMPGIRANGAPVRFRSGWINGIKALPVTYRD